MGLASMALLRLAAPRGLHAVLAGVVGGMLLRLMALTGFCFGMTLIPEIHLTAACLSAAGGLVLGLIIDSAIIARSLSAHSTEAASEVARV